MITIFNENFNIKDRFRFFQVIVDVTQARESKTIKDETGNI